MMRLLLFVAVLLSATDQLWAKQRCCADDSCFNDNLPFNGLPLPECPEKMSMRVTLYTRHNRMLGDAFYRLRDPIVPSSFNGAVMTVFLVHGWLQNEEAEWLHSMKNNFLAQGDYNVIIFGWNGGADHLLEYSQSASNTRAVGRAIAVISNSLINKGNSSKALMYCVGHSLGAHACGHAGQQGQFGRITGLDPAGPEFEYRHLSAGLNPSCADLVDVIHTDGGFAGTLRAMGHIDFYPNGGKSQPGCLFSSKRRLRDLEKIRVKRGFPGKDSFLGCSHSRSHKFFLESIRTPCFLVRQSVGSQLGLPSAKSSAQSKSVIIQSMGFNATAYSSRGKFSFTTNKDAPFCRG